MFWNKQNMRFYNVLWNDNFFINKGRLTLIKLSSEAIYMHHIVENCFFIIFTHFLKFFEIFETIFMDFSQIIEKLLKILIFFSSTSDFWGSKNVPCGCRQNEKTLFLKVYIVSEKSVILLSSYMRNSLLANIPKMWSKFCCFWLFLAVFEEFVTPPQLFKMLRIFGVPLSIQYW